ncbi:MAG: response regulator [Saprospirales bacterium]|nr:response regulator [Saprospirales bacterium]
MAYSLFKKADAWLTRIVSYPGDDQETIVIKRIWLVTIVVINFLSTASAFHWLYGLGLKNMFNFQLIYFGYFTSLTLLFLWIRRGIEWFVFATAIFHILFSFVIVCLQGGIVASAGMVFIGWGGGPIYFLLLQKSKKWAVPFLVFFVVTVIVEIALQPYLTPDPDMSPGNTLIIFSGFFLVITIAVFFMLRYSIGQNARIKQAEKDRLQELAAMKTRFYTNITHEFRTPLTVILGMADQIEAKPADHFRSGLGLIRQNGNRLLHLVNQMLSLSKLEAGVMPVHLVRGDVVPYLLYMVESFQRLAEKKRSQVQLTDLPDHLELDFDPEKLESLLGNLLSNAVKHSPAGSEILVSAGFTDGDWEEDPSWFSLFGKGMATKRWFLGVKDNGKGISEGELSRIFDRFYQANPGPVSETEGTGIGLSVVKELVKLLEGDLLVKSAPGQGAEFRVYLPFTQTAAPAPAAVPVPLESYMEESLHELTPSTFLQERPQVLVVEDNSGVVQYLQSILEGEYQIGVAVNGREGIERALEWIPDLIISDVMMPEQDGFELCRTLKSDFRTSHIPIILLTAKADTESTITGLEQGADAYVTTPFNSQELLTRVRKLIELRHSLREKYRTMALSGAPKLAPSNHDEAFLKTLMTTLENHMGEEDFHAGELSQSMGINRVQLFRKLKALTGQSASDIVRSFRLNKAKSLLTETDLHISEIAYEVGFKDPAYFSRVFFKEFGMAPSALRK